MHILFLRGLFLGLLLLPISLSGQRADYLPGLLDSIRGDLRAAPNAWRRAKALDDLSQLHYKGEALDSAYYYADRLLELARSIPSDSMIGNAFRAYTILDLSTGKQEKSFVHADSSLYYYRKAGYKGNEIVVLTNLAYHYARFGDCVKSLAAIQVADSIQRTMDMPAITRIGFRNTHCAALEACGQYDLVPALAREYLPEARALKNYDVEASLLNRLLISYRNQGELDSALFYVQELGSILTHISSPSIVSTYYGNAANVYHDRGELERARELMRLGLARARRSGSIRRTSVKAFNLGTVEVEMGNTRQGLQLLEESLDFFEFAQDLTALQEVYPEISKAYAIEGQFEAAYVYSQKGFTLSDSLQQVAFDNSLAETAALNEAERVRRDLEIAQLETAEQRALNKARLRLGLMIFAGLLALIGGGALYIRNRRRRKDLEYRRQQAELRYSLLRAQMNPHFIFNSLNAIQNFFSGNRFSRGNEYLGTFSQLVRRILEQTGEAAITLEEELDTLRLYLDLEQLRMGDKLSYSIHVDPEVETEILSVPPLVLQPFVENAIWHGIGPKNSPGRIDIFVSYREDQDALYCVVQDDGLGIQSKRQDSGEHRSRGVEITRNRLGKGGQIDIRNRADHEPGHTGVRTELLIPLWD